MFVIIFFCAVFVSNSIERAESERLKREASILQSLWKQGDAEVTALYDTFFARLKAGRTTEKGRELYLGNIITWNIATRGFASVQDPLHIIETVGVPRVDMSSYGLAYSRTTRVFLDDREIVTDPGRSHSFSSPSLTSGAVRHYSIPLEDYTLQKNVPHNNNVERSNHT